jgi:sialidase-1
MIDVSGNSNAATCAAGQCPGVVAGISGNAMMFDGATACFNVPSLASWMPTAFTISAWIKSSTMVGPIVVHESSSGCPSPELEASNGVGLVQLNITDATPHNEAWTAAALPSPGQWHQIAVAWDGANQSVYVDGVCACEETQTLGPLQNVQPFSIGCYPTGSPAAFTGAIDEVRIYDRALALDEIANLVTVSGQAAPTPVACAAACATVAP